jgi:hypothetical protein
MLWTFTGLLIAAGLAGAGFFYMQRRKKRPTSPAELPASRAVEKKTA